MIPFIYLQQIYENNSEMLAIIRRKITTSSSDLLSLFVK